MLSAQTHVASPYRQRTFTRVVRHYILCILFYEDLLLIRVPSTRSLLATRFTLFNNALLFVPRGFFVPASGPRASLHDATTFVRIT